MKTLALALIALTLGGSASPAPQLQSVVAESVASGAAGVAAFQTRLDGSRRYQLQIDGPEGTQFVARYFSVHVGRQPARGATGNDDGSFEGTTPYTEELVAAWPDLVFWRYSLVVNPQVPVEVSARLIDLGPR